MTIDPEMLMAYADGALDPLNAKRVERAIADDPTLGEVVTKHRRLKARLAEAYAPIHEEPVPDRLAALLSSNVTPLRQKPARATRLSRPVWQSAAAMAACLVIGVLIGRQADQGPISATANGLYASGTLASALDEQASGGDGAVRIAASFRAQDNGFCRVFQSATADGIACRDPKGWSLRRTLPGSTPTRKTGYAQAGSSDTALMVAAQDMMADMPLDAAGEKTAMAKDWRAN